MKWGRLYGPDYVNRLYAMTARHVSLPFRFVCFTDDAEGIRSEVDIAPLPPINLDPENALLPWRKIGTFNAPLHDLEGVTMFLDLDIVITASLDPFFDYEPGKFCIIHNWTHPGRRVGNSSVYRFEAGTFGYILDRFHSAPNAHWIGAYRNSQTFLSNTVEDMVFWPDEWCVSFKKHCMPGGWRNWVRPAVLPEGARIAIFHGTPNPTDAVIGRWPDDNPVKQLSKRIRPAPWVADHWLLLEGDQPPFGAYRPGALGRATRAMAQVTPSRRLRSVLFRAGGGKGGGPRDVAVFGSEKARLHPADNLSEKRVLAGDAHWEIEERAFLARCIADNTADPFHFVDIGANAGLYTLAARSAARRAKRPIRALAIEPSPVMLNRLRFNLAASGCREADVQVLPGAATATAGPCRLSSDTGNRGESRLDADKGEIEVTGWPLLDALTAAGFGKVDALKIDIEGAEAPVLGAFFDTAPKALWPNAIIIEGNDTAPGVTLCLEQGYRIDRHTRMNTLLIR